MKREPSYEAIARRLSMISLHQLSVFRAVARHQSFSRAAEELGISQPAVSAHVRELERLYGAVLLEQVGRQARLTEAGELLEEYAERLLALVEEARQALDELKGLERGHLAIGASTIPGTYFLPEALGRFKERHPGVEVTLKMGDTRQALGMLRRGEVALAVVGELQEESGLQRRIYRSDELVLVVPPQHRWAREGPGDVAELAGETFILREQGSSTRENAEALLRRIGIIPRVAMEWPSTEAIKKAVEAGLGVSILSSYAVALEVAHGLLAVVRHPMFSCRRQFYIVCHQDRRLSPAAQAFAALLEEPESREGTTTHQAKLMLP
jgi:LysR family transcriptional regulator, low CO2-responsive transcriptional regulator